jgi:glycosyltransferase involved in cell wall biosynthesis
MSVYNGQSQVISAIESIQSQTFGEWEMIVVDDGSSDNTYDLLEEAAKNDFRIKVLSNNHNLGLAASLNKALGFCRFKFIARMDSDDRNHPERFSKQVSFLEQHLDIDVLGASAIEVDSEGRIIGITPRRETHEELVFHIYKVNPFIHSSVMARREFFDVLRGYDESLLRGQDYDLWLRGYHQFRYHNLQEPLIYYRRNTTPNWRDAIYTSRVIMKAIKRDRKPVTYRWYAIRPLLAMLRATIQSHISKNHR